MENVLEIEHLSLSLPSKKGKVPILHDVNLTVGAGKILGLVGESGSGKSMTAFAVTRLLPGGGKAELGGSIRLMGRQLLGISEKSMEEVRGRDVSMIFQEPMTCLNPVLTTYREDGTWYDHREQAPYMDHGYLKVVESRLKAVRDTLGPDGDIILENHAYTDRQSAVRMGNMAKKYDILYFEEPVAPHGDLLRYVHQETGIPIASGERMYSRWQFKQRMDQDAIQVIQPDIGTCGGITEVKKICDMAYVYETAVQIYVCGSPLVVAASLHLESAIPGFIIHEYNVNTSMPKMTGLTKYNYEPENGMMTVPELPGIGNEIADATFDHSEVVTIR